VTRTSLLLPTLLALAGLAAGARAEVIEAQIAGTVDFTGSLPDSLIGVEVDDEVLVRFRLQSESVIVTEHVRSYEIDLTTVLVTVGDLSMGLFDFPDPTVPPLFFSISENGQFGDAFWLSNDGEFPDLVPLDLAGVMLDFQLFFSDRTLVTDEVLDALGSYTPSDVLGGNFELDFFFPENAVVGFALDELTLQSVAECFLVIGSGPGVVAFAPDTHEFTAQVDGVDAYYPVLLDDIPEFVIPGDILGRHPVGTSLVGTKVGTQVGTQGGKVTSGPPPLEGLLTVQVLMWNPGAFPDQPEQFTQGLAVRIGPDGDVATLPYGEGTGMAIWAETGVNGAGQPVLRFPFSIPGM
jgi:hypothetical protein